MENLTREDARILCDSFLSGDINPQEAAKKLINLADKGETAEEIAGFSDSLLSHAQPFPNRKEVFDLCGTGGSSLDRFNVSTSVAFILASLGVNVAKHGNRGSRKPNGSFDLLEELGINIDLNGNQLSDLLDKTNLAFVYARKFHTAMKNVVEARKIANRRTIFNLAGPISNPANVTKQLIGTVNSKSVDVIVETLKLLKRSHGIVLSGYPEIDELSVSGESIIAELSDKKKYKIVPNDFNIPLSDYENIPSGNADVNAKEFLKLIDGVGDKGIFDMVSANAGISLYCVGAADSISEGVQMAQKSIISGMMKNCFEQYKKLASK